jgi:hypothetical protein
MSSAADKAPGSFPIESAATNKSKQSMSSTQQQERLWQVVVEKATQTDDETKLRMLAALQKNPALTALMIVNLNIAISSLKEDVRLAKRDIVEAASEAASDKAREMQDEAARLRKERDDAKTRVEEMKVALKAQRQLAAEEIEEMRSQREASTLSSAMHSVTAKVKSDKLPDPPVFNNGSHSEYKSWERQMRDKLTINEDRYDSEAKKVAYAAARIGGIANGYMAAYLDYDSASRLQSVAEFFEKMRDRFADPFAKKTAREHFKRLRQGPKDFQIFLGEFQRLAAEGEFTEDEQLEELQDRMNDELKQALFGYEPETFKDLVNRLKYTDRQQRSMKAQQAARKSTAKPSTSPATTTKTSGDFGSTPGQLATTSNGLRPHRDVSTVRCYGCGEMGHYQSKCPSASAGKD